MPKPRQTFCSNCHQDLIRDCQQTLGATDDDPCLVARFKQVTAIASSVEICPHMLLALLQAGVPLGDVLDIIQSRLELEDQRLQRANNRSENDRESDYEQQNIDLVD